MSKFEYKKEVYRLRSRGMSLNEISSRLPLSKSTISLWCRDFELTEPQKRRLQEKMIAAGHKGRILGSLANKRKKQVAKEQAAKWAASHLQQLSSDTIVAVGAALYWAEGSKSDKHQLSFVNSDPSMIFFMYKWFQRVFDVGAQDFIVRVFINEIHKSRIDTVLNFWSNLLELPKVDFRKTVFIKTKQRKVYLNHNNYYGLLSLRIKRSSVIKYKTLSLVEGLRNAGVAQVVRASHS